MKMDEVITVADATTRTTSLSNSASPNWLLLPYNLPLLSAFLAGAFAQFLKLFTTWSVQIRMNISDLSFHC